MKCVALLQIIEKVHDNINLTFKAAIRVELPQLLRNFKEDEDLPKSFFQTQSKSLSLLNIYGVLYSLQNDFNVKEDKELNQELQAILTEIKREYPDLDTAYDKEIYKRLTKN